MPRSPGSRPVEGATLLHPGRCLSHCLWVASVPYWGVGRLLTDAQAISQPNLLSPALRCLLSVISHSKSSGNEAVSWVAESRGGPQARKSYPCYGSVRTRSGFFTAFQGEKELCLTSQVQRNFRCSDRRLLTAGIADPWHPCPLLPAGPPRTGASKLLLPWGDAWFYFSQGAPHFSCWPGCPGHFGAAPLVSRIGAASLQTLSLLLLPSFP